jgi:hypothetical protein
MPIVYRRAFFQDTYSTATNRRSICRDGNGHIFIGYTDYTGAWQRAVLARSANNGVSWVYEEIPGQGAFNNEDVNITVDSNNNVIVVWKAGTEVIYRKRLENGTWNAAITIGSVPGHACEHPSVAIDSSDTAHIVWKEDLPTVKDDIRYNTVSTAGALGVQINVTNLGNKRQVEPHIAVCRNNIAHIIWQGTGWGANLGFYNIKYNTVTAGVLGAQVSITDKAASSKDPECAVDSNGFVHILYREEWELGTLGLYYTNNIGGAFALPTRIATDSSGAGLSITLDAEDNRYAFSANPTLPSGTVKIYSNKGAGWVISTINMTRQYNDVYSMWSWYPRVGAISPNILSNGWLAYVFWPKPDDYVYLMLRAASHHPTIPTEPGKNRELALMGKGI